MNYFVSIITEFVDDSEFNWQYMSFFKIRCDARGPPRIIDKPIDLNGSMDKPDSSIETLLQPLRLTIWSIGVEVIAIIWFLNNETFHQSQSCPLIQ